MPTPTTDYVFDLTAALTPIFGSNAAAIEQAIQTAIPNAYRGLTIGTETTPATTGQPVGYPTNWYAWQKQCLWIKPSTGILYYFNGTTWAGVKATPAPGTITASMIVDKTITLGKLNPDGIALQIPHISADGTVVEWLDPTSLYGTGQLAVNKLTGGGAGIKYLKSTGGTVSWVALNSAELITLFDDGGKWPLTMVDLGGVGGKLPLSKLETGSANMIVAMSADGTALSYRALSSLMTATPIADYSIGLIKLAIDTGNAGKYLRYDPVTGVLTPVAFPLTQYEVHTDEITTLPGFGASTSKSHGLSALPTHVVAEFVCVTAELGYSIGDCVNFSAMVVNGLYTGTDYNYAMMGAFVLTFDATMVYLTGATDGLSSVRRLPHKTTGMRTAITSANWKVRFTATRYL